MGKQRISITPTGWIILEYLAKYRFLAVSHFQMIGLVKSGDRSNIHKALNRLKKLDRPLIGSIDYPALPRQGRFESYFYITYHGWEFLNAQRSFDVIKFVGKTSFTGTNDYQHKKNTLSACLAIDLLCQSLDYEFKDYVSYFDQSEKLNGKQKQFKPRTYLYYNSDEGLAPDALFQIRKLDEDGNIKTFPCCLELYNGRNFLRTFDQLIKHVKLLTSGAVSDYFSIDKVAPALLVFEEKRLMERIYEKLTTTHHFSQFLDCFWLIELDRLINPAIQTFWIDGKGVVQQL